jgi:PHP family Zn ribbon phosphoesterase
MSPRNIIREAKKKELDVIAVSDHNSGENFPYVKRSAEGFDIVVIGGMEITSREEAHILAFFKDGAALSAMQEIIYNNLSGENDERYFGDQVVVNENDEVIDFNKRLLIGATDLSIENIIQCIYDLDGMAIASHIDRESFSIISQLGFIPKNLKLDALEVSDIKRMEEFRSLQYPLVTFSDAHALRSIGTKYTNFYMEEVTLNEMRKSLMREEGREVFF